MKYYFYTGALLIVLIVAGLLGYGVYLNQRGENLIAQRMENNRLPLVGVIAKEREITPVFDFELVNLYSDEMTDVVALTSGRITKELVEKNSHVKAGSPILSIIDEDIPLKIRQAESDILEAEAQFLRAKNSYKRYEELRAQNAVSEEKFDEIKAAYRSAEARLSNNRAKKERLLVEEARQRVVSPIDGEVLSVYRKVGSYVSAGTAVALVGNFKNLRFTLPMENKYARHISLGQEIEMTVVGNEAMQKSYGSEYRQGNLGGEQVFIARVVKISPGLSEEAAVRQVVWEVDNSSGILEPGVYSRVQMRPRKKFRRLTIPVEALTDEARTVVAVADDEGRLQKRAVETGASDGEYVHVLSGLNLGDVVIVSNTQGLKEGILVDVNVEKGDEGYAGE